MSEPTFGERWIRTAGWASLVANIGIVVTGGAVRLTGSGLGCPTWPRYTEESFTPYGALDVHQAIEFGNRMITFILVAIAVATFLVTRDYCRTHKRRDLLRLSVIMALGIPLQAVIGGISVLTQLSPWVVGLHMVTSLAIVGVCATFLFRLDRGPGSVTRTGVWPRLGWATFLAAWAVLYVGTVVTGAGPHAGDAAAPRNGLDTLEMSQLHADLVFLLLGLTVALTILAPQHVRRAALTLLVVELAQGVLGFVQYFTDLPIVMVGLHMLGSALTSAAVTWVLLEATGPDLSRPDPAPRAVAGTDSPL